jgi:hypothetical protein
VNLLSQARSHFVRCAIVSLAALLSILFNPSAFAVPSDELSEAVRAGGAADVTHASASIFLRGFTAVALGIKPRDLPGYVEAAVKMRPELAGKIVGRATRITSRKDPKSSCTVIAWIVRAAVAANPASAVAIAKAAIAAKPAAVHCIIDAASKVAPEQEPEIAALETSFSLGLLSAITATSDLEMSYTSGTLNPANLSDFRENTVVSPEQPFGR